MGIFDFLKRRETSTVLSTNDSIEPDPGSTDSPAPGTDQPADTPAIEVHPEREVQQIDYPNPPEIPEEIFVEYKAPNRKPLMEPQETIHEVNNLSKLYQYLEQNLEKKGYEDALMNPDTSYRDEHIRFIHNELDLMISKVKTYYAGTLRTHDLHIETRKRGGMIELVDELLSEKATLEDELSTVSLIEGHSKAGNGLTENLFLSYKKGFQNGLAAITYNTVLARKQNDV